MAITFRLIDAPAPVADLGTRGVEAIRLTGDGAATTILVTLPASSGIKTIKGCTVGFGSASHNIPLAGIAAATGFTITFAAAPAAVNFDAIIWGDGR